MDNNIWYKDIINFFHNDNIIYFFPTSEMTNEQKLNSILRFSIYFSIILFLINKNIKSLYLILITALLTFLIHKYDQKIIENVENYVQSNKSNLYCTKPSKLNPFMNVTLDEYVSNPSRAEACDIEKEKVQNNIEKYFEHDIYKNVDDIYSKNMSSRQFYTNPSTTIPNDQEAFAKWLYYNPEKTCKEGNGLECY